LHNGERATSTRDKASSIEEIADGRGDWRLVVKRRIAVTASLLALPGGGHRRLSLQVIDRADLVKRAERQQVNVRAAPARRSSIDADVLARASMRTATTRGAWRSTMRPRSLRNSATPSAIAGESERSELIERLKRQRNFAFSCRRSHLSAARQALNLDGIASQKESRRYYPNRDWRLTC
jgi:hypothetical protein